MKEIKVIHVAVASILFLFSFAIFQWAKFPKYPPPPMAASSAGTDQAMELPALPQNELGKPVAAPAVEEELFLFEESSRENGDKPKDPALSGKKPAL